MKSLVEELRAGAELEEAYDADGIIRTGYQPSLRWRAATEIERLRAEVEERNAKINRLQEGLLSWKELKLQTAQAVLSDDCCGGDWRDGEIRTTDVEIERLRELVAACAIYLKEDETPVQRIERERADTEAVLKLLLKEKREVERLHGELAECERVGGKFMEAIETLRLENSQWQSACAGYTEALAARDRDNTALREELTRIRDQIAKHNISIKEAIRRGEAFEWKTLTLDS